MDTKQIKKALVEANKALKEAYALIKLMEEQQGKPEVEIPINATPLQICDWESRTLDLANAIVQSLPNDKWVVTAKSGTERSYYLYINEDGMFDSRSGFNEDNTFSFDEAKALWHKLQDAL